MEERRGLPLWRIYCIKKSKNRKIKIFIECTLFWERRNVYWFILVLGIGNIFDFSMVVCPVQCSTDREWAKIKNFTNGGKIAAFWKVCERARRGEEDTPPGPALFGDHFFLSIAAMVHRITDLKIVSWKWRRWRPEASKLSISTLKAHAHISNSNSKPSQYQAVNRPTPNPK